MQSGLSFVERVHWPQQRPTETCLCTNPTSSGIITFWFSEGPNVICIYSQGHVGQQVLAAAHTVLAVCLVQSEERMCNMCEGSVLAQPAASAGLKLTGLAGVWWQAVALLVAVFPVWLTQLGARIPQSSTSHVLLVGLIASRFGLWLFDLAVSQMLQEWIPEDELGRLPCAASKACGCIHVQELCCAAMGHKLCTRQPQMWVVQAHKLYCLTSNSEHISR